MGLFANFAIVKNTFMKRIFIVFAIAVFTAVCVNAQLLYRISGNGLEKPSYVVGTYHLAPASFVDSIPGAREALASVEQVCGELDMRDVQSPDSLAKLTEAMRLPGGKYLKDVLGEEEMAKLNGYMMTVMGVNFTNPMVESQLGRLSPAAIQNQLQLLQYIKLTPGFNPAALVDVYFQTEAAKAGKPVIGFETMDMQIAVLYKGVPLERQKELLMCMIDNQEYTIQQMRGIADAYFAQDMERLVEVADESVGNNCDSTPEEKDALIYDRNADWAGKFPAIAGEKATLFVVGALHLPGERGLLQLLKNSGYIVDGLK